MRFPKRIIFCSIALTGAILLLLYGISTCLQNLAGPARTVVYLPGGEGATSLWILLDTIPPPVRSFRAHFHSSRPFKPIDPSHLPNATGTELAIRAKRFRIISLNGERHSVTSGLYGTTTKDSVGLVVTGKHNRLLTVLLPIDAGIPEPSIRSIDSGRTYIINTGNRSMIVHLGTGGLWKIPALDFSSNSDFLVATWETRADGSLPTERSLVGTPGSTTIWGGEAIRLGAGRAGGTVSLWENGEYIPPIVMGPPANPRKAAGLNSRPLGVKSGLANPGNYGWKCDRAKLAARFESGQAPDSYFLPAQKLETARLDSGGWKDMLDAYRKLARNLKAPSEYPEDKLPFLVAYTAMAARADGNAAWLAWVQNALLRLDTAKLKVESFTELRAHYGWWYLTAYDLISPSLSSSQRMEIQRHFREYFRPVVESVPYLPVNATALVLKSSLGLAGLLLNEPEWVDMMVNHLDWYMDFGIPEGIAYEGNLYLGIAFNYVPVFSDILNRSGIGNVDFFKDERYQNLIASLIMQVSPSWSFPCFEDCGHSTNLGRLIASSGAGFSRAAGETGDGMLAHLASMCEWVEVSSGLPPEQAWLPDFPLVSGSMSQPVEPTFSALGQWMLAYGADRQWMSFPMMEGGMVILRSGWERDSDLFALSAKDYPQSHTRMDELSFELWSIGEHWLSNPEYGGFGERLHARSVLTQSSNSLTIDGRGQVNPKGSRISDAVFGRRIRVAVAEGAGLYRHPARTVLMYFVITGSVVIGLLWGLLLLPSWIRRPAFTQEGDGIRCRVVRSAPRLGFASSLRAVGMPFARSSDVKLLAAILISRDISSAGDDLGKSGIRFQAAVFGLIAISCTAYLIYILVPFVKVFAEDQRYSWLRPFLQYYWILLALASGLGAALAIAKFKMLDLFVSGYLGRKDAGTGIAQQGMRILNLDLLSLGLFAITSAACMIVASSEIRFDLLGSSPDPWSFQSHISGYVTGPSMIIAAFLFLKSCIQYVTARNYALLLMYITGSRKWYYRGLQGALVALTLKKATWFAALLFLFFVLLKVSGNMSAEILTHSLEGDRV